jgi:flagellar basal body-associated protein FliL
MDYIMIGSIYVYGYFILIFWQVNSKKLLKVFDFVHENFHQRSRGEKNVLGLFEVIEAFELNTLQAQRSLTSTKP